MRKNQLSSLQKKAALLDLITSQLGLVIEEMADPFDEIKFHYGALSCPYVALTILANTEIEIEYIVKAQMCTGKDKYICNVVVADYDGRLTGYRVNLKKRTLSLLRRPY